MVLTSHESLVLLYVFFNDTATPEIYTLSLHDALPICSVERARERGHGESSHDVEIALRGSGNLCGKDRGDCQSRSEEHTSELQSHSDLVCRLLLEKKKNAWQRT